MNKKSYLPLLILLVFVVLFSVNVLSKKHNLELQKGETVMYSINLDLDKNGESERVVITRVIVEPFVNKDTLYVENSSNNPYASVVGTYSEVKFIDIDKDKSEELIVYSISGQLVTTQIFRYTADKVLPIPFVEEEKEVVVWSNKLPDFIDLDGDEIKEIVVTHILKGKNPTEIIKVQDFYRFSNSRYIKYKDETNVEGGNFAG